jgi:hypothetical protein
MQLASKTAPFLVSSSEQPHAVLLDLPHRVAGPVGQSGQIDYGSGGSAQGQRPLEIRPAEPT